MQAAFRRIVTHIAAAHGCEGEAVIDKGYPVTMNDARATAMMKDIAGDLGGDAGWHAMPAPMMGAEDFSYVLRKVPGAMSFIGVAAAGRSEEHTSELQSLMRISYAVFCLKKK